MQREFYKPTFSLEHLLEMQLLQEEEMLKFQRNLPLHEVKENARDKLRKHIEIRQQRIADIRHYLGACHEDS